MSLSKWLEKNSKRIFLTLLVGASTVGFMFAADGRVNKVESRVEEYSSNTSITQVENDTGQTNGTNSSQVNNESLQINSENSTQTNNENSQIDSENSTQTNNSILNIDSENLNQTDNSILKINNTNRTQTTITNSKYNITSNSLETYKINNETLQFQKIIYVGAGEDLTTVKQGFDYLYDNDYKEDAAIVLRTGTYSLDNLFSGESYNIDPKYNEMDIALIAEKPGKVYSSLGEIQMSENNTNYYINLQFYGIIFKNAVYGHAAHLNGDKGLKEYYNCVFECPVGGWNGNISNASIIVENCLFTGGPSPAYYEVNPLSGKAINCASTDTTIEPCNGTKTTCITGVTIDSSYHVISAYGEKEKIFWEHKGTGTNPDGTRANIGVYGGRFAWAGYESVENEKIVAVGKTEQISIVGSGANSNKTINFSEWEFTSSNTSIATVNGQGVISGISEGNCTITAHNTTEDITTLINVKVWNEMYTYQINNETLRFKKIVTVGPDETYTTLKQGFDYLADNNYKTDVAVVLKAGQYTFQDINTGYSTNINGKYNQMDISIIADEPGKVKVNPSEMGVIEEDGSYSITLKFYRLIFNNAYGNFHTNMESTPKQYFNCVFETPYGGYSGMVSNTKVLMENCVFMVNGNGYYSSYPVTGYAINSASATSQMEPYNGAKLSCIYNAIIDSDYYIDTNNIDDWEHVGMGCNPDGTQANIGVYGGRYAWQGYKIQTEKDHIYVNETMKASIVSYWEDNIDYDETEWEWTSSDTDIAEIDSNGIIYGKEDGNITITATSKTTGATIKTTTEIWGALEEYKINNETLVFRKILWVGPTRQFKTIVEAFEYLYNRGLKTNCAIVLDEGQHSMQGIETGVSANINPKYTGMNVSIIGDDPGRVRLIPGEFGMAETGTEHGITLKFYRVIFNNRVQYFHLNTDKQDKEYYNCVFETPYGGWNEQVPNSKAYIENCLFNTTYDTQFSAQAISGKVINSASTNTDIGPLNATKTSYLTNVTIDDMYHITSDGYIDAGVGEDPNGSQADIGVYGGKYAWVLESRYATYQRNEYVKANDTLNIEIYDIRGYEADVDETKWEWTSSDNEIATVENGIVTGKKLGTAMITGSYKMANKTLYVKVIVHVYNNKVGAITEPDVEEGEGYTIVLKEDGTVWAVGLNDVGQLGDGTNINRNIPVQVKINEDTYLTNVVKISTNYKQNMALTADGNVYTWGLNTYGVLGIGTTQEVTYAQKVKGVGGIGSLENIIDISMGHNRALVVDDNGKIYCWGDPGGTNVFLGNAKTYTPIEFTEVENVITVNIGYGQAGSILNNAETWIWGENAYGAIGNGSTSVTSGLNFIGYDISQIECNGYSAYIVKDDKTVWASGQNNVGQLGIGNTDNKSSFTKIKLENGTEIKAKEISAGAKNLMVIGVDGKVYVAGYNDNGQLCDKTTDNSLYLIELKNKDETVVSDAINIFAGNANYLNTPKNIGIVRNDGTIWLSGDNTYGQIGNASYLSTDYLTLMGDGFLNYPEKWVTIGVNDTYTIKENDFYIAEDMNVFIDGSPELGTLSYEVEDTSIAILESESSIKGIKEGITKVLVTDSDTGMKTYIWVKVSNTNIAIDSGSKFTVSLKQNKTVWTWGQNNYGQLGLGNNTNYNEPQEVILLGDKNVIDVKAGYFHAVALTANGEVYTWGYNGYGQLGNGTKDNQATPVKVEGLNNIVKIDAYKYITVALNKNGEVYIWGNKYETTPTKLTFSKRIIDIAGDIVLAENRRAYSLNESMAYGKDLIKISAGENHYLGLTADGEVIAWGTNNYGQLGNGNNTSSNTPTKVLIATGNEDETENISNIVEISAGNQYSIISDKDGNVYTFGYSGNSRLAGGSTRNLPLRITDVNMCELVSGSEGEHTVIADWDGYVFTAGLNDNGQLGLGDNNISDTFKMIGKLQIESNPEKIVLHVGETKDVELFIGSSFNLKTNNAKTDGTINKEIANANIATISGDTVTGVAVGKTILNATYKGILGTISQETQKFYRNIEIQVLPKGGIVAPKVDSGNGFTVSLKSDGTIWAWGANDYGQLGIGNTTYQNEPREVSITNESKVVIEDIAVGANHGLALTEKGTIYAWGLGNYGQLGIGNTWNQHTPVIVKDNNGADLTDIVKIEAGEDVSFAINSKGEVYAWGKGYNSRAQKLSTVKNVIDVTSKYVLTGNGDVYDIAGENKLAIVGAVSEMDEGTNHTVFLGANGRAYAIGDNTYGELGDGRNVSSSVATEGIRTDGDNLFTGIKEIKAGDKTTVLVTNDGKVYAFGMNDNYELGTDDHDILDYNLPMQITNISDAIMVAIGDNHVTAVKSDGTVYDWGNGANGQLGNRKNKNSVTPVMVGDFIVRTDKNHLSMAVGDTITLEGEVEYFNLLNNDVLEINYSSKDPSVASVSTNLDATTNKYTAEITANDIGTTAIIAAQVGTNNIGVIQVEALQTESKQTGIVIEPNVVTNGSTTISLRVDGKVYTWGSNSYGQLGIGTTKDSDEPVEVKFSEGTIITQIAIGEEYCVALDSEGNVWTWGRNNYYQIGHYGGDQYTPYKISGLPKVSKIAAGNYTTMVITEDKELYGWGFNAYANIGLGNYTNKILPTRIVGFGDVIDISGGKNHFTALTSDGNVYVTGSNLYGQLGNGDTEVFRITEFTKVELPDAITWIDSGDLANMAVSVNGYVYAWGSNSYGQLGINDKTAKYSPIIVDGLSNIREVEVGKTHSIARDGNGKVYLSGANTYGQLGNGTKTSEVAFTQNTKIDNVLRVSAGDTYTTLLKKDGFVWACGDYNHGDSTKKSITNSKVPVLVGSDTTSLDMLEIVLQKSETKSIMANAKFKFNLIYIEDNDMSHFEFESYNSGIVEIDSDGDMMGIREGTTWVKATDTNNGNVIVAIVRVIDNTSEYTTHVAPKVVSGESFAIGLKEDGSAWIWGYDDSGLAYSNIPANINVLATYQEVDAGKHFAIALRDNGTVWTIGDNSYGQLGQGDTASRTKFIQIQGLSDITQIVAGENHAIAIDNYGIVYGWGENSYGELGSENTGQNTTMPVVISIPNEKIAQIAAGKNQTVFVTKSGKVYGMGSILNGYVKDTSGNVIDDVVKVDVGNGYILILRKDGSISKYQIGILTKVSNAQNAIDISVQEKTNMYQSLDERAYTWGVNDKGQAGTSSIQSGIAMPTWVEENGTNVFRIGAGYNNTYIIANTGFVYAAGNNTYGELGNGTSTDSKSTTYERSLVHTLVGDRSFEVKPTSNTLEINEVEDLTIESNTFNVFKEKEKDSKEYSWQSENGSMVTVLKAGEIQAVAIGQTNIVVTDPITNASQSVVRVVVPVDTDRIKSITANGKEADVIAAYTYEVRIPLDDDETTANVVIQTKLGTDQISVNGGETWTTGSATTTVDIPEDSSTLAFKVKTEAGNELNYTLTILRLSNNNELQEPGITVKKAGETDYTPATKVIDVAKIYEVIVPASGVNVVKVTAKDANATVSINGLPGTLKEQSYNLVMSGTIREIPIKITSASGRENEYVLMAYTSDYVTTLKNVYVNDIEATKIDDSNYEVIIDDLINISEVKAITNVSSSKVKIGNGSMEAHQTIRNVTTIDDITQVEIYVESEDGSYKKTYNLTIKKQKTQSWIQSLKVNGSEIEEINTVYDAYVDSDMESAEVEIIAKDTNYYITLADFDEEIYSTTKNVDLDEGNNSFKVHVRDEVSGEIKEYTLNIHRKKVNDPDDPDNPDYPVDTTVGIKRVYTTNGNIIREGKQTSLTDYEIRVSDEYTSTFLTVIGVNPTSLISIDENEFKVAKDMQEITLTKKETEVKVVIKTEDEAKEEEYTIKIIRCSDDTSLRIEVDEYPDDATNNNIVATLSPTEANTYDVQLQNAVNIVDIIATATDANASIKIQPNSYSVATDTLNNYKITSYENQVFVTVKSEYGTEKTYTLVIRTLSDDVTIDSVVIDNLYIAKYNPTTGKYEVRVPNSYTSYPVKVTAKDSLAKVSINESSQTLGANSQTVTITSVPITVTSQNGITSQSYILEIAKQSNNSNIGEIRVNGEVITPDDSGNYTANVNHTVDKLTIYGQTEESHAQITIDGETAYTKSITIKRTMTGNVEVYTIFVEAEEGGTTTKTLTVNRLSGNTEIASILVETPDENSNTVEQTSDDAYYCKIKRNDNATVTVNLIDSKASVTVAGGSKSETITLLNEETQVNIVVTAEDGTIRNAILTIEKESNDAKLKELTAKYINTEESEMKPVVSNIDTSTYRIKVDSRATALDVSAITNHAYAKVKLGSESDENYVLNKMVDKEVSIDGITSFTIDVLPECGGDPKTYTVEIIRVFSTKIKQIVTDSTKATVSENAYSSWIDANDDIADIAIIPDNPNANVKLYKDGNLITESTGELDYTDTTATGNIENYTVVVSNPDGDESSEYTLKLTKKSTNNNIEYVKLNGVALTEVDEVYETTIGTKASYELEVKAEDLYATISFDNGDYSESNISKLQLELNPGETRELEFTVKSQNGEKITKTVRIYRQDNNTRITRVKVSEQDITESYDTVNKNYSITLDNTENLADLEIVLESNLTNISTTIDGTYYTKKGSLTINNIMLPGIGKKVIIVTVTAEDGTMDVRTITISQFSDDVQLETVKVNGITATKRADGDYEVIVGDVTSTATIFAQTNTRASKVSINNNTAVAHESTVNIPDVLIAGMNLQYPIVVTAEDESTYEYTLYITVKSGDNSVEYVKVDGNEAKKLDDSTYRIFVIPSSSQAAVEIKASGEVATVTAEINGIETSANILSFNELLPQERNYVTFKVTSEAGETKEYTLEIFKESDDNTLAEVYVNGKLLTKDNDTGRYYYSINSGDANPTVKAVANNEFAYVRIALFPEDGNVSEHVVTMSNSKITTVPITIRSQTGVSNVEYVDIETKYTDSTVEAIIVDSKEVTNYNALTKTYTALVDPNTDPHEIFIMSQNTYAKLEINGDMDDGSVTTYTSMTSEEYEKSLALKITSETGSKEEYTIKLVKASDNVRLSELAVNDVTLMADENNSTIYRKSIKKSAGKAKVRVATEYPYATVRISDADTATGSSEVWIDLNLLEDIITIPVLVTAADGETIETYNIILTRLEDDTSAVVSYNGEVVPQNEDENYYVTILDNVTAGLVNVTTNDTNAKVDIADSGEFRQSSKDYTLTINTDTAERTIEVPFKVMSEDETEATSKIIITRISTDYLTSKVERIITNESGAETLIQATIENGEYVVKVPENLDTVDLRITANSQNATISRGTESGLGVVDFADINLPTKVTYVTYKVTAEAGETYMDTYTVKIVKESSDNTIAKLEVDEKIITPAEDGIYYAYVVAGTENVNAKIITTSDQAKIDFNSEVSTAVLNTKVATPLSENTYLIKVTAENGNVATYTLKIVKQTNIVGKVITENTGGIYKAKITVYKTSDLRVEGDATEPREVIAEVETEDDGSFVIAVEDIENYDIVITKDGYLSYRLTGIEVKKGEATELEEYNMIAGDVVITGEIEIDDLVALNNSFGVTITDTNKIQYGMYDFNEDGKVDSLDRNILKKNYGMKAVIEEWADKS